MFSLSSSHGNRRNNLFLCGRNKSAKMLKYNVPTFEVWYLSHSLVPHEYRRDIHNKIVI